MARFILRRMALMLLTLFIVSVLVFTLAEVLPGDVGRTILGPYATPEQVAALNHELGVDRPLPVRYLDWITDFVTGDWGESYLLDTSTFDLIMERLWNSMKLGLTASVIIIPISILMGVLAGLREGGFIDRFVSIVGLSLTAIPEFVSGVILLVLFAVQLQWLPVSAQAPPGSPFWEQIRYFLLPAMPLMFVLFGYIARMARAGTLDVVESQYYRTAVLKGLPRWQVIGRHVLRNSLPPTVTVVALQTGFLVGGLVVIETLFNYPGLGKLLLDSAIGHDVIVLEAGAMTTGVIIMVLNLFADLSYGLLNPRIRLATT
jgi:peptide/nickel transport system permease protein